MRSTTRPARLSAWLPIVSFGRGGVPGACCQRTSLVTLYLPPALKAPLLSNVCQVPPPVTSSGSPGANVPEPVSVIFEQFVDPGGTQSLALAEAMPPAERVPVEKSTLMISHRKEISLACTVTELSQKLSSTIAIPRNKYVTVLVAPFIFDRMRFKKLPMFFIFVSIFSKWLSKFQGQPIEFLPCQNQLH